MSFGNPTLRWLAIATAVLLAIAYALDFTRRRRLLDKIGHAPMLNRMMASLSVRRRVVKAILIVTALMLIVLSLARPQVPGDGIVSQRGIDVAIVIDFSKSMLARDTYPSRIERVRLDVDDLIDQLKADRLSTVLFAGAAIHFPLTHDHEAAKLLYRGIEPRDLAPGSDLGEALMIARCVLRPDVLDESACSRIGGRGGGGDPLTDSPDDLEPMRTLAREPQVSDRARVIVLFTDGEDTVGRARVELEEASRLGIDVYIIGVGTPSGELIPDLDPDGVQMGWKKDEDGNFVTTRLEQAGLIELAEIAGGEGHYFSVEAGFKVEALVERLKLLKKGDQDKRVVRKSHEVYQWLLFPAFMLLLIEACMGDRRRRVSNLNETT